MMSNFHYSQADSGRCPGSEAADFGCARSAAFSYLQVIA